MKGRRTKRRPPKPKSGRASDFYSRRAKKERFPARSVYKLKEIQAKFKLIKKKDRVLDLGCRPGSWLIFAAGEAGPAGKVVGVDLHPLSIALPPNAEFVQADMLSLSDPDYARMGGAFDVVLSDAAPATTGVKTADAARSYALCEAALSIAGDVLREGGSMACKIFVGEEFSHFNDLMKQRFKRFKIFKPQSCRKASREIYVIGSGYRTR
ncbi:Ribosomal RNA large subunit methyltransferase E [Candidatus Desulfarcum epimagneticum]|uniref:Ribosomal RNA large subunit methyltransferase E n=1 Tax=uncultured Desulfobacteraceae bacterium TaxID=218296 RepID=A0A484HK93_9BACT|nr:Ribosomal RNA large subunit methyltransferase E [uncultured Desulfobacteraceae bacterium]